MTPSAASAARAETLWSPRSLLLFAATFLAYANTAVFFQYVAYLHSLPIDPRWTGSLIGIFAAVSLVLRPVISPFFHPGSTRRYLIGGTILLVAALLSYRVALSLPAMLAVRALHGLAFVVLGTALLFLLVERIPESRSAQAFGLLAVVVLIPNTLIPPLLPFLTRMLGGFANVLTAFAAASVLVAPLALAGGRDPLRQGVKAPGRPLTGAEILADLKDPNVVLALGAMLLLYSGYAMVFFFIDGYGRSLGIADTGFFLTLATVGEIGVRLAAGALFDRSDKRLTAGWTMTAIALGYVLLAIVCGRWGFLAVGLLLGLAWGVSMPVFNGLLFDLSEPRTRGFNVNLGMQMFQGGFFIGPFVGSAVAGAWGFRAVYWLCSLFALLAAGACFFMIRTYKAERGKPFSSGSVSASKKPIDRHSFRREDDMTQTIDSAPDVIAAGQPWEVRAFEARDAEGVARLFKSFYGRQYPIRAYVEPEILSAENRAQRIISSVAVTPRNEVVGHNAIFRSAPYAGIYESGAGLVHSAYRGGHGILTAMVAHGVRELAPRFGLAGVHGESVCNHVFSQKMMKSLDARTCALEVDLMPASAYGGGRDAGGRVAALHGHITLVPKPHGVCIPSAYREVFEFLYGGLDDSRDLRPAGGCLPPGDVTRVEERYFDFAQTGRLTVSEAGADFGMIMEKLEASLAGRGAHVLQVLLPLADWAGAAVDVLRDRGWFLGGLLPRWFDKDGMMMQKVAGRPDWEPIQIFAERDRRLLGIVRQDWQRAESRAADV